MGSHFLLQGMFHTQGLNLRLPHCRWMLFHQVNWDSYLYPMLFYPCHMEAGFPSQEQSFLLVGVFSIRVSRLDYCLEFSEQVSSQQEEWTVLHDQKLIIKGKHS